MNHINKPLVTVIFLSFNHEQYLKESLDALFSQDYSNLDIIISDDCSSDSSYDMINNLVDKSDARITVRQNESNLGISAHINTLMALAKGELCFAFAGDDISAPHRISTVVDFWLSQNKPASVFSAVWKIDEDSKIVGTMKRKKTDFALPKPKLIKRLIYRKMGIFGCSHAWRTDVYRKFGNIAKEVINEDRVIPLRSVLVDGIKYCPEPLVYYRITSGISAINRDTKKQKLFEFNRISSIRELNDLKQNKADCDLLSNEYANLITGRESEVKLLLQFSQKQYSAKGVLIALRGKARFFKVTDICINYLWYWLQTRFVR